MLLLVGTYFPNELQCRCQILFSLDWSMWSQFGLEDGKSPILDGFGWVDVSGGPRNMQPCCRQVSAALKVAWSKMGRRCDPLTTLALTHVGCTTEARGAREAQMVCVWDDSVWAEANYDARFCRRDQRLRLGLLKIKQMPSWMLCHPCPLMSRSGTGRGLDVDRNAGLPKRSYDKTMISWTSCFEKLAIKWHIVNGVYI